MELAENKFFVIPRPHTVILCTWFPRTPRVAEVKATRDRCRNRVHSTATARALCCCCRAFNNVTFARTPFAFLALVTHPHKKEREGSLAGRAIHESWKAPMIALIVVC